MNHSLSEPSKHLNARCHFFSEYVDEVHVKISKCSTEDQCADYLTKGLVVEEFVNNRKSIQGS